MAAFRERKLCLQVSPHSVSIAFQANAVSLPNWPQALVSLRMSRGSRAAESLQATLQEEPSGSNSCMAKWTGASLPLNVSLSQEKVSGKYENKEIEFQLRVATVENDSKQEILASCTYDLSRLNLCALDSFGVSSETRQISLNACESTATVAIRAIIMEATFHCKFLSDEFDISVEQSRSRETSPYARSTSSVDALLPIVNDPNQTNIRMMIKQPDNHTRQEMFEQQNITSQHTENEEDSHSTDSGGENNGSSRDQNDAPSKPPRKRFQWFKKIKRVSKHSSTKQDHSKVVQSSSSTASTTDPSRKNLSMESASAEVGTATHILQSDEVDRGINPVRNIEVFYEQNIPPPKPKRSANRHKLANTITNPELPPEKNGDLCQQSGQQHEESSNPPHIPLSKPLPLQHKRLSEFVSSDVDSSTRQDRTRLYSAPFTKKGHLHDTGSKRNELDHVKEMTRSVESNVIPKQYHPIGNTESRSSPRVLSKHISGSTPHLPPARLIHERRSSSASHLAYQDSSSPKYSISNLKKPMAFSSHLRSSESSVDILSTPSHDQPLGILKVRLKALDTFEDFQRHVATKTNSLAAGVQVDSNQEEGLHCVFTINGSNGQFRSSVKPLMPHRITTWDDEEVFFYTKPQSKKLFVLCQRSNFEFTTAIDTTDEKVSAQLKVKNDKCIGAAVLEISSVAICSSSPTGNVYDYLAQVKCDDYKLTVQPKGTILLQSCLHVLQPRFRVSCSGTLTIQTLSGINCNPNHELSCTVKMDSEFQDDTNPQLVEQCVASGWKNEPVDFKACSSYDCSIQICAYSCEETEYWCGGCVVPLAMLLPDEEVHRCNARGDTTVCALATRVEKKLTLPVEPKGVMQLVFSLAPSVNDDTCRSGQSQVSDDQRETTDHHKHTPAAVGQQQQQLHVHVPSVHLSKRASFRRTTTKKAGNFQLKVWKSYSEEPFCQEDSTIDIDKQTVDLKREVEFLREELRKTKARLAESEFYREQAQLELKTLQEKEGSTEKEDSKSNKKTSKQRKIA